MVEDTTIDVLLKSPLWADGLPDAEDHCRRAAIAALQGETDPLELCVVLADDDFIRSLNRDFRNQDKATNVLSFPAAAEEFPGNDPKPLGDIVVAYETTAAEADYDGKQLDNHLSHLIVHGVLHLLGADHQNNAEAEVMEARETEILTRLGIDDPYNRPSDPID